MKLLPILLFFLFSCGNKTVEERAAPASEAEVSEVPHEYEEGVLLVEFTNDFQKAVTKDKLKEHIKTKAMERGKKKGFYRVEVSDVDAELARLSKSPDVKWVSKNYKVSAIQSYPNDSYFNTLWGMTNINAPAVWANNKGDQNVYVGIIDEGIMHWHEDLCGQIWDNPFDRVDGIDNDGNGYVDDTNGYCFYHSHNKIFDFSDQHGTHVAGTIGGKGNNGIGVIGVAPNVTIISAKFLEGSGLISNAIKAVDYLTDLKLRHNLNIAVINNSWGGPGFVQGMYDAIERAKQADILFVAAAGNSGSNNDVNPFYPASYSNDNVVSVAAIASNNTLTTFSCYGATTVDLGAPGFGIMSSTYNFEAANNSTYSSYNGTSMAAPHVTGAAAIYKAANPTATYSQIKNALLSNARPAASLAGKCVTGGVLDIGSFLTPVTSTPVVRTCTPPTVDTTLPSAPANVRVTARTNTSISLAWDASYDPESGIKNYRVKVISPLGTFSYNTVTTSYTGVNLGQGATYTFTVYALNGQLMVSAPSVPLTVTTTGELDTQPPGTPTDWKVSSTTLSSVSFGWTPPIDNVGVAAYNIRMLRETGSYLSLTLYAQYGQAISTATVTGLPNGVKYACILRAGDGVANWSGWTDTIYATTGTTPIDPVPPVDTIAPVVEIISPKNNYQLPARGSVTISAKATDNVSVKSMAIYIDNVMVAGCTGGSCSYSWGVRKVTPGVHIIKVTALDAAGNTGNTLISVLKL